MIVRVTSATPSEERASRGMKRRTILFSFQCVNFQRLLDESVGRSVVVHIHRLMMMSTMSGGRSGVESIWSFYKRIHQLV